MKNYRVTVKLEDFSFFVEAWDEEDAKEEAKKQLEQFTAVIQDVTSDFEVTQEMRIASIDEE